MADSNEIRLVDEEGAGLASSHLFDELIQQGRGERGAQGVTANDNEDENDDSSLGSFDEPSNKRVKKNNFSWTDEAKLALAKCVSKCKAFKKTKDESFGEKYVQVLIRLKRYFSFYFPKRHRHETWILTKIFQKIFGRNQYQIFDFCGRSQSFWSL